MIIHAMKSSSKTLFPFLLAGIVFLTACKNEDPIPENIPELITKVVLTFSPTGGGSPVTVTANDPDGGGVQDIVVDGPINLLKGSQYTLSIELINELYLPGDEDYNITEAVKEEGEEHQFFFSFSEGVFSSPTGAGNIKDNASSTAGSINYLDVDNGGLPIGISTSWTTVNAAASDKSFRVILKHQPEIKSTTSTSLDGESDLDITFVLNVN
jgi:hypothetical protein